MSRQMSCYIELILGETGTGKELLARRLHGMSKRAERPFVIVDLTAERGEYILLLARHFLLYYARKHQRPGLAILPGDEALLLDHPWPGNVRQLQNVIERAVLLADEDRRDLSFVSEQKAPAENLIADIPTMDEWERRYIAYVIDKAGGRIGGIGEPSNCWA